jgi:hypothetical protein
MKGKKQYYALDEIGIVGVQNKASKTQVKRDMKLTSQYFKAYQSKEAFVSPKEMAKVVHSKTRHLIKAK